MRQALQQRLEGTDAAVEKRFALTVLFSEATEPLGIQTNSTITRMRDIGKASWVLARTDQSAEKLTFGTARSVDGYDILNEQFFYQDLTEEATQRRLADALADQIIQSVALYFRTHPNVT